jgi:diacylglycerol kinase family enzyme
VALVLNNKAGTLLADGNCAPALPVLLANAGFDLIDIPAGTIADQLVAARDCGADIVAIAGGDGTVACAAQSLANTGITLGILPCGTMNLLAKDLAVPPADPAQAVDILRCGRIRDIDAADIGGHIFLCAAMFGSPARLGHHREEGRRRGNSLEGWLHFGRAFLRAAVRHRALRLAVTLDGARHELRTSSLTITVNALDDATGRMFGRSVLDSGTLYLYALRHRGILAFLRLLANALLRRFTSDPSVVVLHGQAIEIRSNAAALRVLIDGEEHLLPTPLSIRVLPRALHVLVPAP